MIRLIIYIYVQKNLVIIHAQSLSSPSPSPSPSQSTYMRNTLTSRPAAATSREPFQSPEGALQALPGDLLQRALPL